MSFNTVPFNPFPPSSDQRGGGGGGSYVLPIAADDTLGGIKVGDNLTIEEDGTLNAEDPYTLPIAADDTLGGIKVGDNLTVEEDGTLNAVDPYTPPAYSTNEVDTGKKWIDGSTVYERVFVLQTPITVGNDWVSTGITISNVSKIIRADGLRADGECYIPLDATIMTGDTISVSKGSTGWNNTTHIILMYTKTESEG